LKILTDDDSQDSTSTPVKASESISAALSAKEREPKSRKGKEKATAAREDKSDFVMTDIDNALEDAAKQSTGSEGAKNSNVESAEEKSQRSSSPDDDDWKEVVFASDI
jgi:hypothetical protein